MKIMTKRFTYGVGHRWNEADPDNVSLYAYGRETFHGTMEEAEAFRKYCQRSTEPTENDSTKYIWRIYKLVEVE